MRWALRTAPHPKPCKEKTPNPKQTKAKKQKGESEVKKGPKRPKNIQRNQTPTRMSKKRANPWWKERGAETSKSSLCIFGCLVRQKRKDHVNGFWRDDTLKCKWALSNNKDLFQTTAGGRRTKPHQEPKTRKPNKRLCFANKIYQKRL